MRRNVWEKALIIILFCFIFSSTLLPKCAAKEKQIIVVLRFDDYSSQSSTDMEVKLIDAFQNYNVSCTFGVIPYVCAGDIRDIQTQDVIALTPLKSDILNNAIKAGILDIALHGYSHQTIQDRGGFTEFFGLEYNTQVERIAKGKRLLEEMLDTQITTFIPPWNSYDLNTIRALEKLKFSCISAGVDGYAEESSPLKFLPCTCVLSQLREAVESERHIPEIEPIIIVLFHEYDFLDVDRERGKLTFEEFLGLLGWLTSQKNVHVVSLKKAIEMVGDLSANRFIKYGLYGRRLTFIPPFLINLFDPYRGVYLSPSTIDNLKLKNMKIKLFIFASVFYFAILLISIAATFSGGYIIFPKSALMTSISKYGVPCLLVLLSVYALQNFEIGYRGAMVVSVGLGSSIGVWSCFLKLKRQGRLK